MSTEMPTTDRIVEIVEDIIDDLCPHEQGSLPFVVSWWRANRTTLQGRLPTRTGGGLPSAQGDRTRAALPLLLCLERACTAIAQDPLMDPAELESMAVKFFTECGLDPAEGREFARVLLPCARTLVGVGTRIAQHGESGSAPTNQQVWIESWIGSRLVRGKWYERDEYDASSMAPVDLEVDELNSVFLKKTGRVRFDDAPYPGHRRRPSVAGLWLVLVRTDTGKILPSEVARVMLGRPSGASGTLDPEVPKAVTYLRAFLEGLGLCHDKILPKALPKKAYLVRGDCWSWRWIRKNEERVRSELYPGSE